MIMRLRLFLSFVLVVLVAVSSVVLIVRSGAATEVRAFMFRGGMLGVDDLVRALEDYYASQGSWQGVQSLLRSLSTGHAMPGMGGRGMGPAWMGGMMNQRLRLADAEGNLVADSQEANPSGRLNQDELQRAIPLMVKGQTVGYLLPEGGMAFSQGDETRLVSRISRAAWSAGLIGAGLSLVLALLLAYQLLRPIQSLTRAAQLMARGDLSQRVAVHGHDELAALGQAFNHMAESLQRAEESRRAMTADIAHELRNPLAVQRAHLEALQDGIYPLTVENLTPILEQNQLLTRLVEDLRTLALADAGQLKLECEPADLALLVESALEHFAPQAAARRIELRFHTPTDSIPSLHLDPQRIDQILSNLLSNALRYTPEGGVIELRLATTPSTVQLVLRDSGPGIPPEALPYVFERFYRADKGRSRSEGGTGLGLAIARKLAEAHGGSLTAANHPQGGAVFTLTLPVKR
jgi:two-component system OmpR family sensor kinase/two-component system sensor histidine kinase BaeS